MLICSFSFLISILLQMCQNLYWLSLKICALAFSLLMGEGNGDGEAVEEDCVVIALHLISQL